MDETYTESKFYWIIAIVVVVIILSLLAKWYEPIIKRQLVKIIKASVYKLSV